MKRTAAIITLLTVLHITGWAIERGVPFFRNYSSATYKAHNRNFDIVCDDYGTVFVANFEGLVYYDGATWRKIHTPGISRVTCLAKDTKGRIWIGGYNVFGYLVADKQGRLQMKLLMSDTNNKGDNEVDDIEVRGGNVYMRTTQDKIYYVKNNRLELLSSGGDKIFKPATDSLASLRLPDMVRVAYNPDWGLKFILPDKSVTTLSESDGLSTNAINYITYDNMHTLWAATSKGILCTEVSTPYSRLTDNEGLKGEVFSINELDGALYIGTQNGLFILRDGHITDVRDITLACWNLVDDDHDQLIAPTSQGLYVISRGGLRKLTSAHTLSAYIDKSSDDYIVGETNGVFRVSPSGQRVKIAAVEKVMHITANGNHLTLQNIYGAQWLIPANAKSLVKAQCIRKAADPSQPKINYHDRLGRQWKTNVSGTDLQVSRNDNGLASWITPLKNKILNVIHVCKDGNVIAGGDFGIIIIDARAMKAENLTKAERPYIRQITAMGDSVIWGGYSPGSLQPVFNVDNIELPSSCHDVTVTFSTKTSSLVSPTLYRYRFDGGTWSKWSEEGVAVFTNPYWSSTTLEIQARDIFGNESEISTVKWEVSRPWFLSIWAIIFYLIIFIYIITLFFRWRERRLEQEKQKLEGIVSERTSELSAAYDKQQKISSELSDTLDDLKRTQDDLVRMERTATAGKLTQGLIDRILNPINYINNFSKLTSGLAKDLREDIEDEKDNMSEDNYEDCEDLLDMMNQNLSKIEEHGVNTTRTLRAMEAMLNNHVGTLVSQDICPLCRQVVEVTTEHFKDDITQYGITVKADLPQQPIMADIDAESINRVLLSLVSNSIYAISKKYRQSPYTNPEVIVSLKATDSKAVITIHDNGIGIEDAIKEKVFDPFFTTKPTGEASGVGLYLVREIIHDHKGTITLDSAKGEYCTFTITL